jgi:hypothetical protein
MAAVRLIASACLVVSAEASLCQAKYHTAAKCKHAANCTWCECVDLPPTCFNLSEAAALPPSAGYTCSRNTSTAATRAGPGHAVIRADDGADRAAFAAFKARYGRHYGGDTAEEAARFCVFAANLRRIERHNSDADSAKAHSYSIGVNQFADLTADEFADTFARGGFTAPPGATAIAAASATVPAAAAAPPPPTSRDWRSEGAVNAVRNQYQCGACWAFSATAAAEAAWALSNGTLPVLSEQELIDCSAAQGNTGCAGGSMDFAFSYMAARGPGRLCDGRNYKFSGSTGFCFAGECTNHTGVNVTGFRVTPKGDEAALLQAVAQGVVSVGIQANQSGFQLYKDGVFDGVCGDALDHAVALVGWGEGYWIVRNSWGTSWGEGGYMRLQRGTNKCGVANAAIVPTVGA